eukprot:TRINITY_DN7084_c0_g1_i1.p1 TRINITY_DN7084_c0_g1~~TRINITY_DN7084_c0_g1_i1.p1  ORF type:complete len:423 (-),score=90.64 TRINITY_DN7084_c0_g1_i1:160-1428(-)
MQMADHHDELGQSNPFTGSVMNNMPLNTEDHEKVLMDQLDNVFAHQGLFPGIDQLPHVASSPEDKVKSSSNSQSSESKNLQKMTIMQSANLAKLAAATSRKDICPALSKPTFSPDASNRDIHFVVGTEDQMHPESNYLLFSCLSENGIQVRFAYSVMDYVRDLAWIDDRHIVMALNQKLGVVRVSQDIQVEETVMFPEFHKDAIREIAINQQGSSNLVISGGFDGNVFVTDISKLIVDIRGNQKKSENSLYPCKEVVSSVNWHIEQPSVGSCTTDQGILHLFDIRTDRKRQAIVHDTMKKELYTHAYKDGNTMLLGFGDAQIHAFDIRNKRAFVQFSDIHQSQVGEIRFDHVTKNFAVFGTPAFTLWNYDDSRMNLCAHHHLLDGSASSSLYKTSGDFRKGTRTLGVTDSYGTFAMYAISNP